MATFVLRRVLLTIPTQLFIPLGSTLVKFTPASAANPRIEPPLRG